MKKEILTPRDIRFDLRKVLVGGVILAIISSLFLVLGLKMFLMTLDERGTWLVKLRIAIFPFCFSVLTIHSVVYVYRMCTALCRPNIIVKDRLVSKRVEDHITRHYRCVESYHLHFASYGEYAIPSANYQWSELYDMDAAGVYLYAECGDEFYLVLSKPHTGRIMFAYNAKMFDYQPLSSQSVTSD